MRARCVVLVDADGAAHHPGHFLDPAIFFGDSLIKIGACVPYRDGQAIARYRDLHMNAGVAVALDRAIEKVPEYKSKHILVDGDVDIPGDLVQDDVMVFDRRRQEAL